MFCVCLALVLDSGVVGDEGEDEGPPGVAPETRRELTFVGSHTSPGTCSGVRLPGCPPPPKGASNPIPHDVQVPILHDIIVCRTGN